MKLIHFLQDNYFLAIYIVTLFVSIIKYRLYFDSSLKYIPVIITYTLATEILGILVLKYDNFQIIYFVKQAFHNNLIFNLWDIIFFSYFYYIYWKTIKTNSFKKIIKYGGCSYILISIINLFVQNFVLYPQIYALSYGSLLIITCIILYFIDVKSSPINIPNSKNLLFWISIGLFLFYTFYPFIMISMNYYFREIYQAQVRPFHLFLIVLMYSCFIIGFIRMRRIRPQ